MVHAIVQYHYCLALLTTFIRRCPLANHQVHLPGLRNNESLEVQVHNITLSSEYSTLYVGIPRVKNGPSKNFKVYFLSYIAQTMGLSNLTKVPAKDSRSLLDHP